MKFRSVVMKASRLMRPQHNYQMDIISPRVFIRIHMSLHNFSSSSSPPPSSSIFGNNQFHSLSLQFNKSNMEKHKKVEEKEIREGFCKEACDYNAAAGDGGGVSHKIIPHILNLYASTATPQDFDIYAPHATFEDPLMSAHGRDQIKSAFYSIPKVFSESKIVDYTIQENKLSPGKTEILIDNKQYYKFLGKDINMISLIKLYTEDGKIVRHEDWWDKKPLWNRETVTLPFLGRITEATRRASMLATHALMRFGKDPNM